MYVFLYNKRLKHLEVLIRFLRFPECPFLLHGVEHSVAILSLFLVQGTDDNCRLFYFMCTYRKLYNLYYVHFLNYMYTTTSLF